MRLINPGDACWTGANAPRTICSRGGIGCPLPHDGRPVPEMPEAWNRAEPVCPIHHASTCYGGVCHCPHCPEFDQRVQKLGLTDWTRRHRAIRRAKHKAYARWLKAAR